MLLASSNIQITKFTPRATYMIDFNGFNICEWRGGKTANRHFSLNFAAQISEKYI